MASLKRTLDDGPVLVPGMPPFLDSAWGPDYHPPGIENKDPYGGSRRK
jgi:hypothetical protein